MFKILVQFKTNRLCENMTKYLNCVDTQTFLEFLYIDTFTLV